MLAVFVVDRSVLECLLEASRSEEKVATPSVVITEVESPPPANSVHSEDGAKQHLEGSRPDVLGLCLAAILAALPAWIGHKYQLRESLQVKDRDEPEWMLNTASTELQCLNAEAIFVQGMAEEALDIMTKVCLRHTMLQGMVATVLGLSSSACFDMIVVPKCAQRPVVDL